MGGKAELAEEGLKLLFEGAGKDAGESAKLMESLKGLGEAAEPLIKGMTGALEDFKVAKAAGNLAKQSETLAKLSDHDTEIGNLAEKEGKSAEVVAQWRNAQKIIQETSGSMKAE